MSTARSVTFAVGSAILAVLLINHAFAIPLAWSIALSLPLGALVLLASMLSGAADANWEAVPVPTMIAADLQASMLAARLAEAADDQHRFVTRVRPRLRRIALATVRARPGYADLTTVDDPRARVVLGAELHRLLTDPDARLPEPRRLAALLAALEEQ